MIEKEIRYDYPKYADLIAKLQMEENNKLELSAKLQLARQEAVDNQDVEEKWSHVAHLEKQ